MRTFSEDNLRENEEANKYNSFTVQVHGEVVVKEFKNHVRISKRDWDKFSPQIIEALKQGDKKHATGSIEKLN